MGNFHPVTFKRIDTIEGHGKDALETAKTLRLSHKEFNRIYEQFQMLTVGAAATIDINEMFIMFRAKHSRIGVLLFQQTANRRGDLTFQQFLLSLWSFLTMTDDMIAAHLFSLFDSNRSNALNIVEVELLVYLIQEFQSDSHLENALKKLESRDGLVTIAEFVLWCRHFTFVLRPVVQMRDTMQRSVVFRRFWKELTSKRLKFFRARSIWDITDDLDSGKHHDNLLYFLHRPEIAVPMDWLQKWQQVVQTRPEKIEVTVPLEIDIHYKPPDLPVAKIKATSKRKGKKERRSIYSLSGKESYIAGHSEGVGGGGDGESEDLLMEWVSGSNSVVTSSTKA